MLFLVVDERVSREGEYMKEGIGSAVVPSYRELVEQLDSAKKLKDELGKKITKLTRLVLDSPEAKEYYSRIGKPYQLSIMVDGPPGSGKNSLFKVLMKEMFSGDNMRHLIIIPPDTIKDFTDWEEILYDPWIDGFFIPTNKRVYQIDEIEKAFPVLLKNSHDLSKEEAKKHFMKNKMSVSKKQVSTARFD